MKSLMALGGLIGFTAGLCFGLLQQATWANTLLRASLAAYVAGLLMRWWGRLWIKSLRAACQERTANLTEDLPARKTGP